GRSSDCAARTFDGSRSTTPCSRSLVPPIKRRRDKTAENLECRTVPVSFGRVNSGSSFPAACYCAPTCHLLGGHALEC
ncbi:unnamed protein product, partial [Ectocarpus sp. 12 AP-2014]